MDVQRSPNQARTLITEGVPGSVVFFSPSGVKFCLELIHQLSNDRVNQIMFAAIGPTTSEAMVARGLAVSCTAQNPTPQDLADGLKNCLTP
ncbi:unnamed protein product [Ranitomeya imitator]|uniref:Tetrapyrrole biosynthesis uroporphyrinogen III synthase domain-containing protein n=1 Tax=Ranitomeya imitator TaxID=111125 RepID=A0ABN9L264_9NEOB|nr:unnamed protein product [Ranitomeya imitator]